MRISDWSSDVCSSDLNSEYLIYSLVAVVIIYIFDGIQNLIYGQHPSVHPCRRQCRSAHPSGRRRRTPARTHHRGTAVGRPSTERAGSEERHVGQEGDSTGSFMWCPEH